MRIVQSGSRREDGGIEASMEKLAARDNLRHNGEYAPIVLIESCRDLIKKIVVRGENPTSEGISSEFFRKVSDELSFLLPELLAQSCHAFESATVDQCPCIVDRITCVVSSAEASDRIEALQRETERIDALVTDGAGSLEAV